MLHSPCMLAHVIFICFCEGSFCNCFTNDCGDMSFDLCLSGDQRSKLCCSHSSILQFIDELQGLSTSDCHVQPNETFNHLHSQE